MKHLKENYLWLSRIYIWEYPYVTKICLYILYISKNKPLSLISLQIGNSFNTKIKNTIILYNT